MKPDKNLRNVADDLEQTPAGAHEAQQLNQSRNDRRKQTLKGTKGHDEDVISLE